MLFLSGISVERFHDFEVNQGHNGCSDLSWSFLLPRYIMMGFRYDGMTFPTTLNWEDGTDGILYEAQLGDKFESLSVPETPPSAFVM